MNQAGGKSRREFDRLLEQVGSGDQIALQLQIAGEIEAAVGNHIAGRQEQARGHGWNRLSGGNSLKAQEARRTRTCLTPAYITHMRPQDILMPVAAGLCCKPGGFHIDPVRPVERAVITHGHSDHARPGHGAVLATQETLDMMRLRYGDNFAAQHASHRLSRAAADTATLFNRQKPMERSARA